MKNKKKRVELNEQQKHLLIYVSLLAAGIIITVGHPEGLWLPVGLALGLVIDQFLIFKKKRENAKNPEFHTDEKDEKTEK